MCTYPWGGWPLTPCFIVPVVSLIPSMLHHFLTTRDHRFFSSPCVTASLPLSPAENSPVQAGWQRCPCLTLSGGSCLSPEIQDTADISSQTGLVTILIYTHYSNSVVFLKALPPQVCTHTHSLKSTLPKPVKIMEYLTLNPNCDN